VAYTHSEMKTKHTRFTRDVNGWLVLVPAVLAGASKASETFTINRSREDALRFNEYC